MKYSDWSEIRNTHCENSHRVGVFMKVNKCLFILFILFGKVCRFLNPHKKRKFMPIA